MGAAAALLPDLGAEVRAPLFRLVNAAGVLTRLCETPELEKATRTLETSAGALEELLIEALEGGERRTRAPKTQFRVLCADDDAQSRLAIRAILHAAKAEVELVEVGAGLQAAVAMETRFFDLIIVNLAAPEANAGIRAIRRHERQTKARRTPLVALTPDAPTAIRALEAGADLHVRQPLTAEGLMAALAGALRRQSEELSSVA
jgi:CheY-like chemotaxis protein